ncbi:hypothetical protein PGT21_027657 [Puccinia graminis f. sp. tritici]|uniref:Uncharacterized protein n=1 Tax=Puccinia graminis f. sp. tritici TaxID=56615 RepID=A0A5B0M7D6_PUCGR|nr:hypothetical protein PGT21_027657 [Puccinia graminis f. sp. tritici]
MGSKPDALAVIESPQAGPEGGKQADCQTLSASSPSQDSTPDVNPTIPSCQVKHCLSCSSLIRWDFQSHASSLTCSRKPEKTPTPRWDPAG